MSKLISVIVPVYNVEKYLKRCLESLISQSYEYYEIVLINDGSTDSSDEICLDFASRYPHIVYVSQINGGLSNARNHGIRVAKGDYICFVDSDDYVEKDYLSRLYHSMIFEQSDISCCNYYMQYQGYSNCVIQTSKMFERFEYPCVWNKLYKKSLFENYDIYFPEGLWYEDLATTPKLFAVSKRISYVSDCLYHYCQNESSITRTFTKKVKDMSHILDLLEEFHQNYQDVFDGWIWEYICAFHGICGTIFRMMMCEECSLEEIYIFYDEILKKLNGKRFDFKSFFYMPIKYKIFYLFLWKWSIPLVRCAIIFMKKIR